MTQVDQPDESPTPGSSPAPVPVVSPTGFVSFSPTEPPTPPATPATSPEGSAPVVDPIAPADPWRLPADTATVLPSDSATDGAGTAPLQYPAAVPLSADPVYGYGSPMQGTRRSRGLRAGPVIAISVTLALLAGLAGGFLGFALADRLSNSSGVDASVSLGAPPTSGTSDRPADSIAGVASKVLPTVVSLSVEGRSESSTGSGFVIQSNGYVLTNNHVIEAAVGSGTVTVFFNDGSRAPATIVGRDTAYDLAVLKVEKTGLSVLPLGNSDQIVVGDSVLAVGSPLGLSGTVTTGIVSALNRPVTAGGSGSSDTSFINAIQTDAAINPGNSGGPLVNSAGGVIGVNSAIATLGGANNASGSIGVGFAIPINQARRTAEEIIRTGKSTKPVIGVTLDTSYNGRGAKIASNVISGRVPITPGGPADKAGLKAGDVVLAVNGRTVNNGDELIVAIRAAQPGDTVTFKVQRGGSTSDIQVVLGSESSSG